MDFYIEEEQEHESILDDNCNNNTASIGRWTKEEHEKFLQGIKLYGKVSTYNIDCYFIDKNLIRYFLSKFTDNLIF